VYRPYVDEMLRIESTLGSDEAMRARPHSRLSSPSLKSLVRNTLRNLAEGGLRVLDILTRRAFLVVRGKAY
jgi:hypothetical protein